MDILSEKEKENLEKLKVKFYITKENKDYNYMSTRRIEISRVWAKKLLKVSLYINILSIIFILISVVVFMRKPPPDFYASTPSGKLFLLNKLNLK